MGMFLFWFWFWLLLLCGWPSCHVPCCVYCSLGPVPISEEGASKASLVGLLPIYNPLHLSPGVLLDVQKYFHISDSHAGLLQTGKEPVLDLEREPFVIVWQVLWLAPAPESLAGESWGLNRPLS